MIGRVLTEADLTRCIEARRAKLTRMAASMLGDTTEGEDVVQESALRALRGLQAFRSEADVCSWFQRIVINTCREAARKRSSEQHRIDAARTEVLWRDPSYTVDPEAVAMALESGERMKSALAALTSDQRLAVVMHDLQGWKAREIADLSGLALPTVKSHLRRGRQALVTLLAEAVT